MTGVLLIQLGTPDSPSVHDVRKYLSEFLNDPRVIDIPYLLRKILVNIIIVPFRAPKSAKLYQKLWTDKGSPLLFYSESLKEKVQSALGNNFEVELAMRYQSPSLDKVLGKMQKRGYERIIILPLFPQYASASSGSAIEKTLKIIKRWWVIPELKIITQFYNNNEYINSIVEQGLKYNPADYDHILFSYHGLPVRHVDKVYVDGKPCSDHNCEFEINESNKYCYKAACYATTRLLAGKLNIPKEKYTVCFQSRLNKKWLEPFTDKVIIDLAQKGIKKLLVFSPAFVADCLETIVEVGSDYAILFKKNGGTRLQLVESLNDTPAWVSAVKNLILS
ncbi:MAG: ferrochelatase [Ignavibacteriaceae bacterium]|nr:ferrochelatase [Ignavibacteriaceae bacterium]